MCRWIAYSGTPVLLSRILFEPKHNLIDQSLRSRLGVETTNGDGFGIGWYAQDLPTPGVLRDVGPAWNNQNLQEVAHHVCSGLFFAHIRATTGTAVQQSNCHPFRKGRWLWMHNGSIGEFARLRRDLALAVDPALYSDIEGSTDSELMFFLSLTFGLTDDPPGAVERMAGFIERTGHAYGVRHPLQMTVAVADGERLWAFRYSSEGASRSLYYSTRVGALRSRRPETEYLRDLPDTARLIVSEPLGDFPGAWNEVPESTYGIVQPGGDELRAFRPQP
ncbi:class II glutamine amidotransferase [Streptomyces sp. H51]|uniref:class II glutamine amidotransferase n=1 Tax=Streptomyces sp. H51 TaxID=3111770 RepID=UPI002D79A32D|nr:class II glutamine amidotransferase [Streptomyces sp. H51]